MSVQHFPNSPFRPHMFATWAQHGSTNLQLSTTWTQLRPNLGPTCRNLATSSTCLGATSAQAEPQHGDMAGPFLRNGSKLPNVGADLDLHVHSMASTWGQLAPTWAHRAHLFGGSQAGASPGQFCRLNSENMRFSPLFPTMYFQRARPLSPHRTKLRMLNPTCVRACPSCPMLDPSWAEVVMPKLGPSRQLNPCLVVGPTRPMFFTLHLQLPYSSTSKSRP